VNTTPPTVCDHNMTFWYRLFPSGVYCSGRRCFCSYVYAANYHHTHMRMPGNASNWVPFQ